MQDELLSVRIENAKALRELEETRIQLNDITERYNSFTAILRVAISRSTATPNTAMIDKNADALVRIINAEATGQTLRGKMAVGQVVINRCKMLNKSIYDVVFERMKNGVYTFTPISDRRYFTTPIRNDSRESAYRILSGEKVDGVGNSTYFCTTGSYNKHNWHWEAVNIKHSLRFVILIEGHMFFEVT
jgi:spore germination cell wall hydrolase CwlJ-like protein